MKHRILLVLLIINFLLYTTVLLYLSETVAPYNQFAKVLSMGAFILGAVIVVGFPFSGNPLSGDTKLIFWLYSLFILYSAVLCFISESPTMSIIESFKYYLRILFFFALVIWISNLNDLGRVVEFPMVFGIVFALQSLLLYILLASGVELERRVVYMFEGAGEQAVASYGVLGLGNAFDLGGGWLFIRLQSFFIEPSKFAMFLEFPICLAYGYYLIKQQSRFLFYAVLMTLALIGTFSLAGYLAMSGAMLLLIYFSLRSKFPRGLRIGTIVIVVALLVISGQIAFELSANYVPEDPENVMFNRLPGFASGGSLEVRTSVDSSLLDVFKAHPFGLSLINQYDSEILGFGELGTPNAAMLILSRTGFVGMILFVWIFVIVFYRVMLPQLRQKCLGRYASVGTCAIFIHSLAYGTWLDLNWFYPLALVVGLRGGGRRGIQ